MFFRLALLACALCLSGSGIAAQEVDSAAQIREATWAAPPSMRAGASVLGYGGEARGGDVLTLLRAGTNDLICLADDPATEGFHSACYHESLDPYMILGRKLRAEGKGRGEIMDARYAALETGEIEMPARASLYSVSSDGAPDRTGEAQGERRLTVVYLPGATGEELGLPTRPDGDSPWLMLSGTPWAHVMISR